MKPKIKAAIIKLLHSAPSIAGKAGNVIVLAVFFIQSAFAQVTFSGKTDFTTERCAYYVTTGDFNMDGRPDMAVANVNLDLGERYVSILFNTTKPGAAAPAFSTKGTNDFAAETTPCFISAGDFNMDGKPDMAVANYGSSNVSVFLNTAATGDSVPAFSFRTNFQTGSNPNSISLGNFNGDSTLDMAVANYSSNTVSVLLNTTTTGASTPVFSAAVDFTTGNSPYSVSIGDINGDGKSDMVVANNGSNTVSIFLNTTSTGAATPAFSAKTDFATGSSPSFVSIGDFNKDGKPDMAVANYTSNTVSVFLNTTSTGAATPAFSAKTDFPTGTNPISIAIGEMNGDGKPDLVVADYISDAISILLNTTLIEAVTPSFSTKADLTTGAGPHSVAIDNFNGDGIMDIAVANYGSWTVSVFLNTTVTSVSEEYKISNSGIKTFKLLQNYPNPFNPSTTIRYTLPYRSQVKIIIFNTLGETVAELVNNELNAGYQSIEWDAAVASGLYFYRIEATETGNPNNRFVDTKKMILLK